MEGQSALEGQAGRRPRLQRRARAARSPAAAPGGRVASPHSHVRCTRRRSCSITTRASTVQRSVTRGPASTSSRATLNPSSARTSSRTAPSARACASHSRCSSPSPESSRSGQPSGRPAATPPSDRRREAAPGRLRVDEPRRERVPLLPGAQPPGAEPAAHRVAQPAAQILDARGHPLLARGRPPRRGLGIARRLAGVARGARRARRQPLVTQSGGSPAGTSPPARNSSSASACLQGNFRDGQEHL